MVTRRSFLATILATGVAPAIVRASSLMYVARPFVVEEPRVFVFGNETTEIIRNDWRFLKNGRPVLLIPSTDARFIRLADIKDKMFQGITNEQN